MTAFNQPSVPKVSTPARSIHSQESATVLCSFQSASWNPDTRLLLDDARAARENRACSFW